MLLLAILWTIVVAIWLAIAVRRLNFSRLPISYALGGSLAIIMGSVFGYEFFHIPAPIPITSDRAIVGGLTLIFAIFFIRRQQKIQPLTMMDFSVYGLLAVLLTSAILTDTQFNKNLPISRFVFFYFLPALLYFVVRNSKIGKIDLQIIAGSLILFSVYLALTAVAEWKGLHGLVFPRYITVATFTEFLGRGRGPFLNPISNGIFLTAGLAMAMMAFFCCKGKIKWVIAATVPILFIGNIATLTRSVWLGMLIVVGTIVATTTNRKQKGALLIAGTLGAILLLTTVGSNLINFKRDKNVSLNEMSKSAQLRPIFAEIAWKMFKDRPLLGCGFGQYDKYKPDYLRGAHTRQPLEKAKPYLQHNVILAMLTETGIVGTGFLLMLLINALKIGVSNFLNTNSNPWEQAFAAMLIAILISYIVNGMFHDVAIIPMAHMLLFYVVAINVVTYQNQPSISLITMFSNWVKTILNQNLKTDSLPQLPLFEKDYIQPQQ